MPRRRLSLAAAVLAILVPCVACSGSPRDTRVSTPTPELEGARETARLTVNNPIQADNPETEVSPTPLPIIPRVPPPASRGIAPPPVTARAALVIDEASGTTLFERNADERLEPASLTKIATAVVVLEQGVDLDLVVTVNPDLERLWLEDSASMGLLPGDSFSVRDLLYGLLLASGNDAARELALVTAGSEAAMVAAMNALARRLSLRDTNFIDVDGLGGPGHYASARNLARLSAHAMSLPVFREIAGTETYTAAGSQELFLYNHNPLLNYTPGVDGIKTGYTEEAGSTFVVSAEQDGNRVTIVLLNAPLFIFESIALLEWAFANHDWSE